MPEDKINSKKNNRHISRREFLKDAGLIIGGATVGSMSIVNACGTENAVINPLTNTVTNTVTATETKTITNTISGSLPGSTTTVVVTSPPAPSTDAPIINLMVNNASYEFRANPEWTLRDLLRDQLGLTSIKDMCLGYGACGSCSVLMNQRPVLSCMVLAVECGGAKIETAEGINSANPKLVESYIKNHCMQCGYCTPGFIVTSKALLDRNQKPTEEEIREALGGNLCRCGTYPQHILAIKEVSDGK